MKLSGEDFALLRALQADSHQANAAIGVRINKSESWVSRRIADLMSAGIISGRHAAVDPAKIGLKTTVYLLVSLKHHGDGNIEKFEAAVEAMPNAVEWARLSGSWDFMVKLLVRDAEHYEELHDKLSKLPLISRVRSKLVIGRPRTKPTPLPLGEP